jgi:hypothetical protein
VTIGGLQFKMQNSKCKHDVCERCILNFEF